MATVPITINVNGTSKQLDVEPNWSLAFVLRNKFGLTGTKVGCDMGACGACTVILEKTKGTTTTTTTKKAILSCLMLAVDAKTATSNPQTIWTIEGISSGKKLDMVQQYFMEDDAFQCGFCTPGFIMASKALAEKNKDKKVFPSKDEVRNALAGHICTCGNMKKVIDTMSGKGYIYCGSNTVSGPLNPFSPNIDYWFRSNPRCATKTYGYIKDLDVIDELGQYDKQAKLIVTGDLKFGADFKPAPGTKKKLYARLLLSTKAKAKITNIDNATAVLTGMGVTFITYKECPIWGVPSTGSDAGLVSFWGQEIAAVAAEDPNIAARAVKKLTEKITYQDSSPELNPDILISKQKAKKIQPSIPERGKVDANMKNSFRAKFTQGWTNFFQHGSLETCSCLVWWQNEDLYIRSSTQGPHGVKKWLNLLGFKGTSVSPKAIHFYTQGTGTAHGDKFPSEWCIPAALLSKKAGAPVELSLSRRENFLTRTHQFQAKATIEIGVINTGVNKGKIQALDAQYWGSGGKNPADALQHGLPIVELPEALRRTYKCANARFNVYKVFTNKPKCGWWRCVADSPGVFVEDIAMEKMAEKLDITPLDFKFNNMATGLEHQDNSSLVYSSNGLWQCFEECANKIGLAKFKKGTGQVGTFWHKARDSNVWKDGRLHGVGIAAHMDSHGGLFSGISFIYPTKADATVKLTTGGEAELDVGISRASGGTNSALCHIVAEELGMKYEDIKVVDWGNADTLPDGGLQGGSTRTITLGAAYQKAAEAVRKTLLTRVAKQWKVSDTELKIKNGWIIDTTGKKQSITIKNFMSKQTSDITGSGKTWDKKLQRDIVLACKMIPKGLACETRGVSASAVELLVDETTGEIEILKFANAVDCGRAIFYEGAKKQIDGGIELQLGQGLFYEQIIDKDGATVNPNFLDSKWPTTLDIDPDRHIPIIVETNDGCGPYGAKGMGEPCVSNYVCIADAIYNATKKWIYPPFYPQKIISP